VRAEPAPPAPVRSAVRAKPAPPAVRPAAPQETQTAALPPARARVEEKEALRVVFSGSSSRLTEEGESALRALVQSVAETESRIQLKAFAAGSSDRPSTARRLSLSRALAVRSFLIEQGMRSTRIDVRALGVPADDGPADRVDVILLTQ
jgi:outer membrane protein OmpA-like peptidoglycan-associated protein